jgi:hypothetical protein
MEETGADKSAPPGSERERERAHVTTLIGGVRRSGRGGRMRGTWAELGRSG